MGAFLQGDVSRHGHQVYLTLFCRGKHYNALSQLFLQLVAQIPQPVHIHISHTGRQKFHSFYFRHAIHHVAQRFLCRPALQGLIFTLQRLHVRHHMLTFFHDIRRRRL